MLLFETHETIYLSLFLNHIITLYNLDIISYKTLVFHHANVAAHSFRHDDVIKSREGILRNIFHQNIVRQILGKVKNF